jgi:NAD+ kinase
MKENKIAFLAADIPEAEAAEKALKSRYPHVPPDQADIIIALGGDGFMLHTLHEFRKANVRFYGMNRGSVGFLMNGFDTDNLLEKLDSAQPVELKPLRMTVTRIDGTTMEAPAFNEISLLRQTQQAAKLRISVDGVIRLEELICDGALVSTPAGSTAYNLSAHGPIVPIGSDILCLTPISAFRPRRWRGALLPHSAVVRFDILEPDKRPVSACSDYNEVRDVVSVEISEDPTTPVTILFDAEHNLEERILMEQFAP